MNRDQADGRKIALHVKGHLSIHIRVDGEIRARCQHQGVAVRCGIRDRLGADVAVSTTAVVDDELLAEAIGESFGIHASNQIKAAAGGIGHDDAHRARRIMLCSRGQRASGAQQRGSGRRFGEIRQCTILPCIRVFKMLARRKPVAFRRRPAVVALGVLLGA